MHYPIIHTEFYPRAAMDSSKDPVLRAILRRWLKAIWDARECLQPPNDSLNSYRYPTGCLPEQREMTRMNTQGFHLSSAPPIVRGSERYRCRKFGSRVLPPCAAPASKAHQA